MKGRIGVPALHPLVLPEGRPVVPIDVDRFVGAFARAERAYRHRRFGEAGAEFLAAAGPLLETRAAPELAGARTVCYVNAALAAVAADALVEPVRAWVAAHDPVCLEAVERLIAGSTPGDQINPREWGPQG